MGTGVVRLPAGTIELAAEWRVPENSHDIEIVGEPSTVVRFGPDFTGRALIVVDGARNVKIRGIRFEGNRAALERRIDMPPSGMPFSGHFTGNGVMVLRSTNVEISGLQFREFMGFPILATSVKGIKISGVAVEESGSRNFKGKNNTSGGILLEEGVDRFEVRDCTFKKILGNGIWTHSYHQSPRNFTGTIAGNTFEQVGRDAIQVGHANKVRVENNKGKFIGYPAEDVDVDGQAIPVAVDTGGKVDESIYTKNRFEEINGKCFDLDGFHDGEVSGNVCINRGGAADYPHGNLALVMNNTNPEMQSRNITIRDNVFDGTKFSAMFVIGSGHKITGNKMLHINKALCNEGSAKFQCGWSRNEPNLMQAGIFLGARAERMDVAADNTIEGNEIRGHKMSGRCVIASVGVVASRNRIGPNQCVDEDPN